MSTFSLLISEDFWLFLDFPSDRNIFSTFVWGYKNTAIAEKREGNQKSSLISRKRFEKEKEVCAPDFVEGPHQGF